MQSRRPLPRSVDRDNNPTGLHALIAYDRLMLHTGGVQIYLARPMRLAVDSLLAKAKTGNLQAETQVRLIAAELAVLRLRR
jgi:hypothetical protein